MTVPPDFHFSQNNLQDYLDCPRRFQLRYLLKQKWPSPQSEPIQLQEAQMKRGTRFHELVHQHQLNFPADKLESMADDPDLAMLWQAYLAHAPAPLPGCRYPEFTLTAPFAGYRLVAKFDLLAVEPGQCVTIIDWKTTPRPQTQDFLRERIQTRLYPLMVVLAGIVINGSRPVAPEQVEMIYWFASQPETPVRFGYTEKQFYSDQSDLFTWVTQIAACKDETFTTTNNEKRCLYCPYRSLCGRGDQPGDAEEMDDEVLDLSDLRFDEIGEIRF